MVKKPVSDIAFTEAVKEAQRQRGSRNTYDVLERSGGWKDTVDESLANFLAQRDFFYFGTASRDGRPYIQYRGGPKGFVKIIDPNTLAFADYAGNRQYISLGNLSENDRAFMFFIDYPTRTRIKIWGRAKFIESDPELLARLADPGYETVAERVLVFHMQAWDVNCRKYIHERWTKEELEDVLLPMRQQVAELKSENNRLRAEIAELKPLP